MTQLTLKLFTTSDAEHEYATTTVEGEPPAVGTSWPLDGGRDAYADTKPARVDDVVEVQDGYVVILSVDESDHDIHQLAIVERWTRHRKADED